MQLLRALVYTALAGIGGGLLACLALFQAEFRSAPDPAKKKLAMAVSGGARYAFDQAVIAAEHRLRARATFYELEIQKAHLFHGMVVNRLLSGRVQSECDSLLFSALRYAALHRLDMTLQAEKAWQAILKSQTEGRWYRHPKCRRRPTSRDMILGVLVAFQVRGAHGPTWTDFIRATYQQNGFIGSGRPDVSLLTPGVGYLIQRLDSGQGSLDERSLVIEHGFSSVEFDSLYLQRGYRAHLFALRLWLEMELTSADRSATVAGFLDSVFGIAEDRFFEDQRLQFAAGNLFELDPKNLFFELLWLRSQGRLSDARRLDLMTRLLAMPQFPIDRLPQNCDRAADYLWQRDSDEFVPKTRREPCHEQFSGVDFLWLAALLVSETDREIRESD